MSLLGSLLPGILGAINPANLLKGVVNVGTGILENISKGKPVDISGNLARGLKTAIGEEQSALGSIGGNQLLEPGVDQKLNGSMNAANRFNVPRMNMVADQLKKSISSNAANHRGIWSEDRTKTMTVGKYPANEMIPIGQSVESAPAGMPDRRISIVHSDMKKVQPRDLLNSRDQYGYKSTPVQMQGVSNNVRVAKFRPKRRKNK